MRKIVSFVAAVAIFIVIGIDAWLCIRTIPTGALADSTFNRLAVTAGANASTISHYEDYLFPSD
jgi:hypothetical protein